MCYRLCVCVCVPCDHRSLRVVSHVNGQHAHWTNQTNEYRHNDSISSLSLFFFLFSLSFSLSPSSYPSPSSSFFSGCIQQNRMEITYILLRNSNSSRSSSNNKKMVEIKTENGNFSETLSIRKAPKTEIDRNQRRNERKMRQSKKRSESTNGFSPLYSTIIQVQMHTVFLLSIGWLLFFCLLMLLMLFVVFFDS